MGKGSDPGSPQIIEGEDFYWDASGYMVFTESYLKKRGTCCKSGCRHCPYGYGPEGLRRDRLKASQPS